MVIQALWHVNAFRDAVLGAASDDVLVVALQQIFADLSATEAAAEEGVAPTGEGI